MAKREQLKPPSRRVYPYNQDELLYGIPAWRIVDFWKHIGAERYLVARFVFETLEQANNARIIARAFSNYSKEAKVFRGPDGSTKSEMVSWAGFARRIDYVHIPKHGRRRESLGDATSAKIYGNIARGTLPRDERVRQLIFDLAGYPWD